MHQLYIDPSFLSIDIEDWSTNALFLTGVANVQSINVDNACVERGVKFTSDFVAAYRSEKHMQNGLQVDDKTILSSQT